MKSYQHRQFGSVIVFSTGAIGLVTLLSASSSPNPGPSLLVASLVLITGLLFSTLTIAIEDGVLCASFGPGLIRKKVKLAEIVDVRPIAVRWWYGWGIHLTPNGWLYNISGWQAVEITLRNGRRFCLGTDEPERLLRAIEQTRK